MFNAYEYSSTLPGRNAKFSNVDVVSINNVEFEAVTSSLRANVNPLSNPDPITGGLIIPAGTGIFNMPITFIDQSLDLACPYINDPGNNFTVNADSITINTIGKYRASIDMNVIGTVDNELKVAQVINNNFSPFAGPPICACASYSGIPLTVPFVANLWFMTASSNFEVETVPVTIACKCLFENPTSDVVIALTSNMSINKI